RRPRPLVLRGNRWHRARRRGSDPPRTHHALSRQPRPEGAMIDRPSADELLFLPLGGAGEIGMNLNLYGHAGKWLMIDLGITFGDERTPGVDIVMPDPAFIVERRGDLAGLVLTHAHEDHLGAVPYLWSQLQCPVYATPFTAAVLRR